MAILVSVVFLFGSALHDRGVPQPPFPHQAHTPKSTDRVTAVILVNNPHRAKLTADNILPLLANHPSISEIVVSHSTPSTIPPLSNLIESHIDSSSDDPILGLALRFKLCAQASNEIILHIDSDMIPSQSSITALLDEFTLDRRRIVGKYGRKLKFFQTMYSTTNIAGLAPVILTKFAMHDRQLCSSFLSHTTMNFRWSNGEDIFLSLLASHLYDRNMNFAMPELDVRDAPTTNDENPISGGSNIFLMLRHKNERKRLWIKFQKMLN
tara:strand:+ start:152 stop:952 length:801 start_codon:yes stop_codon:yes gene_type:complete